MSVEYAMKNEKMKNPSRLRRAVLVYLFIYSTKPVLSRLVHSRQDSEGSDFLSRASPARRHAFDNLRLSHHR